MDISRLDAHSKDTRVWQALMIGFRSRMEMDDWTSLQKTRLVSMKFLSMEWRIPISTVHKLKKEHRLWPWTFHHRVLMIDSFDVVLSVLEEAYRLGMKRLYHYPKQTFVIFLDEMARVGEVMGNDVHHHQMGRLWEHCLWASFLHPQELAKHRGEIPYDHDVLSGEFAV
jgi:hypothetical protein